MQEHKKQGFAFVAECRLKIMNIKDLKWGLEMVARACRDGSRQTSGGCGSLGSKLGRPILQIDPRWKVEQGQP